MNLSDYWTRNRHVLLWLALPLSIIAILSLIIAWPMDPEGLLVNVATEALSIIATVLFVDIILRRHEASQWEETDKYSSAEIGQFAHGVISSVAQTLDIEEMIFPRPSDPKNARGIQLSILKQVRRVPREDFVQPLRDLTASQWQVLLDNIESKRARAANILSLFSFRMRPTQVGLLLRFRAIASGLLASYSILRRYVGKPLGQLIADGDRAAMEYSEIQVMRTAIDLRLMFDICLDMIEEFEFRVLAPEIDYNQAIDDMWDPPWAIN